MVVSENYPFFFYLDYQLGLGAETAQSIVSDAMRLPPASIQLASQLPDLIENMATATAVIATRSDAAVDEHGQCRRLR